jgi:hypothetical protein
LIDICGAQNRAPLCDSQTVAHLKVPQCGDYRSSPSDEELLHAVGIGRDRIIEKPANGYGSIEDDSLQMRPSSTRFLTFTPRGSLARLRILSISSITLFKLVSGGADERTEIKSISMIFMPAVVGNPNLSARVDS